MTDASAVLGQLADEFTAAVRAGTLPSVEDYAARCPELAERIRALFPTLLFLEGMAGGKPGLSGAAPPAAASLSPGQTFNHYRVERELGRGGMGVVYEAVHLPLGKRVALKVLPLLAGAGSNSLERFLREARTAAGLHHTNIVPVFDIGQCGGLPYYAMQYVAGCGLDRVLATMQGEAPAAPADVATAPYTPAEASPAVAAPLSPAAAALVDAGRRRSADYLRRVAELGAQAADGLEHAHRRGVVHRDVKPSNLLLDEQGVLWVTDFGLARQADDPALTHSGALVGTPRYMSPEQAEATRRPVDRRSDVYSLGATLYELVTRRPPFTGATPLDVLLQVLERDPVRPRKLDPAVPRDLETVVLKAMAKRPPDRYPTAAALADDLRRWLRAEPIAARRIGPVGRAVRWCRRNPKIAAVTAAASAIVLALSGLYAWSVQDALSMAENERDKAVAAREETKNQLCVSRYEHARSVLATDKPGRRRQALDLLREAADLRARPRPDGKAAGAAELPSVVDLRSLAVTALLTSDSRLQREWRGRALAMTPDNRWAVLERGGPPKEAGTFLADLTTGRELPLVPWGFPDGVDQVALSPDGRRVAVLEAKKRQQIHLWSFPGGTYRRLPVVPAAAKPTGPGENQFWGDGLAFTAGGSRLLAVVSWGSQNGTRSGTEVTTWNLDGDAEPEPLPHAADAAFKLCALSPDGALLACTTVKDERIILWDIAKNRKATSLEIHSTEAGWSVETLAISPNRSQLAALRTPSLKNEKQAELVLWDLASVGEPRLIAALPTRTMTVAFSPDSNRVAVLQSHDSRTKIGVYQIDGPPEEAAEVLVPGLLMQLDWGTLGHSPPRLCWWRADGSGLFLNNESGDALQLWESDWDRLLTTREWIQHTINVWTEQYSPDGRWLVAEDPGTQETLFIDLAAGVIRPKNSLVGATPLRFSPDGRRLAVWKGNACEVVDVEEDRTISRLDAVKPSEIDAGPFIKNCAFNREGQFLLFRFPIEAGERKTRGTLWNVTTGEAVWEMPEEAYYGALSRDGSRLISVPSFDPHTFIEVDVWDVETKRKIGSLQVDGPSAFPFYLPDGNSWLVTFDAEEDPASHKGGRLRFWSLPEGRMRGSIQGLDEDFLPIPLIRAGAAVAFDPDRRLMAIGWPDGSARLYEFPSGNELFRWQMPEPINHLHFTPDGRFLVSGGGSSPRRHWLDLTALRRRLADLNLDW
jgi:serine/threonine protein kinase/WD40 repeat protein